MCYLFSLNDDDWAQITQKNKKEEVLIGIFELPLLAFY